MIQVSELETQERIRLLRGQQKLADFHGKLYLDGVIAGLEWSIGVNQHSFGLVAELVKSIDGGR